MDLPITEIAVICLVISNFGLWVELRAMKMSTHKIAYVDPFKDLMQDQRNAVEDAPFEKMSDDTKKKLTKPDFDNIQ